MIRMAHAPVFTSPSDTPRPGFPSPSAAASSLASTNTPDSTHKRLDHISVRLTAPRTTVAADVHVTDAWSSSLFPTLEDASEFFRRGNVGWSPTRNGHALEGRRLRTHAWRVTAGVPLHIASSYFDELPHGAASLDNVLVMRDVPVQWTKPDTPRANPASATGRRDRLAHHGLALVDVTLERESRLLEHGPHAVVKERGRSPLAWG